MGDFSGNARNISDPTARKGDGKMKNLGLPLGLSGR